MPDGNGNPTVSELQRRVQRVENLLDERIVTQDMLRASEKLYEAREVAHQASVQALEYRVKGLEDSRTRLTQMIITAGLLLLVQAVILVLTITSGGR